MVKANPGMKVKIDYKVDMFLQFSPFEVDSALLPSKFAESANI